jgi:peptidoglycan hydrolase-like protein with peptidoglycan-binding domain
MHSGTPTQFQGETLIMNRIFLLTAILACFILSAFGQGDSNSMTSGPSAKSSSTTKRSPIFRPTKDQIKQVQAILKDKKLYTGEPTGSYNAETRAGIKSFQKDNGLKETGTLNRATLEKFGVALTDAQKAIPVSPNSFAAAGNESSKTKSANSKTGTKVIFRATTDQIKAAQKLMKSKSFYNGEETGKLDDATREGLKKYQQANSLNVTGTLNQATLDKMGIALTDKQKGDAPQGNK